MLLDPSAVEPFSLVGANIEFKRRVRKGVLGSDAGNRVSDVLFEMPAS